MKHHSDISCAKPVSLLAQCTIVFAVCLCAESISALLPFAFPSSVLALLLLWLLLLCHCIQPTHIQTVSSFLLQYMALFFVPVSVGLIRYLDVLRSVWLPVLLICAITTPLVFCVTGWTVQLLLRLLPACAQAEVQTAAQAGVQTGAQVATQSNFDGEATVSTVLKKREGEADA